MANLLGLLPKPAENINFIFNVNQPTRENIVGTTDAIIDLFNQAGDRIVANPHVRPMSRRRVTLPPEETLVEMIVRYFKNILQIG